MSNLRFADDIDGLAGNEEELKQLVNRLNQSSSNFGMEISAEKTKVMANENANGFSQAVLLNNSPLDPVNQFIYLGAIICDGGSRKEVLSRIAQETNVLAKLKPLWDDKNISDHSKIRLLRALATSIFLYACESWTLTADLERRISSFEMRCYRRLFNIHYSQHVTNISIRD